MSQVRDVVDLSSIDLHRPTGERCSGVPRRRSFWLIKNLSGEHHRSVEAEAENRPKWARFTDKPPPAGRVALVNRRDFGCHWRDASARRCVSCCPEAEKVAPRTRRRPEAGSGKTDALPLAGFVYV